MNINMPQLMKYIQDIFLLMTFVTVTLLYIIIFTFLLSILQKSGLAPSRSEARRNVEQGGVSVDGNQVKDVKAVFTKDQLSGEGMVVKRGKKNFKKVVLK